MINIWNFVVANSSLLIEKTIEQIYLAGIALLLALLCSIPLGIWIARKPTIRQLTLATTGILQTIPSLAVLGFLLPFLGIGVTTAIVTLTIYALLPILRNTVSGILSVSPNYIEAADGLGFTKYQKMWLVELPLALPIIIAGIRTATAMSIGIATLAAFIGAGGLGDFIYQGLSLNDPRLIWLGAIPAALLALILDFYISRIENLLIEQRRHRKLDRKKIAGVIIIPLLLILLLISIPAMNFWRSSHQPSIRIGSKNFTEQLILGEIFAQLIEAKTNLRVIRVFNLGGTLVCHQALLNKQIDMYPEYTGTAYTVILKGTNPPTDLFTVVKKLYREKFQIIWLPPLGFNNTNALAVTKDFSAREGVKNISDLLSVKSKLCIGVSPDFLQREDGYLGLVRVYHLNFAKVRLMDPGLMYKAIQRNDVNVIMAYSTDGRIPAYQLVLLNDDKHLFPRYDAAPIIREEFLSQHPQVSTVLQSLAGKISDSVMQRLNYEVDVLHKSPYDVAKNFLRTLLSTTSGFYQINPFHSTSSRDSIAGSRIGDTSSGSRDRVAGRRAHYIPAIYSTMSLEGRKYYGAKAKSAETKTPLI